MLHTLNLGCSFTTFRSRTIINDLDVVLHGSFIPPASELSASCSIVLPLSSENRGLSNPYKLCFLCLVCMFSENK